VSPLFCAAQKRKDRKTGSDRKYFFIISISALIKNKCATDQRKVAEQEIISKLIFFETTGEKQVRNL